ncbi:MAG: FAD-dependent oxidoreductase [Spirochaetes bacterium]|nr:FAD-dependent oxidoreductase [Spirochaetota bacterium]
MSKEQKKESGIENIIDNRNLINMLSHQLKSPITSIITLLNTINQGYTGEINEQTKMIIQKALTKGEETQKVIIDLLDLEFYQKNQKKEFTKIDISTILHKVINKLKLQASEKNIFMILDSHLEKNVFLKCHAIGFEIVITNLLENAIKYSQKDKKILIKSQIDHEKKIIDIIIKDSGFGIPEEEIEHIFEPFYRSIKHRAGVSGTGLGLSIVKKIIDDHDWKIKIKSKLNKGTEFIITAPLSHIIIEKKKRQNKHVVIVGGVTAGPKTAARLRRLNEDIDITIIEKSKFLSYSGCGLPFYISGKVHSESALMTTADHSIRDVHFFESIKNIKALNKSFATAINREEKKVTLQDLDTNTTVDLHYDKLVLATGAVSIRPHIEGIQNEKIFSLYNIEDAERIKKILQDNPAQDVMIIGGGLIGIETAESIMKSGARVTILEKKDTILSSIFDTEIALKIQNILKSKGVKILTNVNILKIKKENEHLVIKTQAESLTTDFVILSTGVKPNVELAKTAELKIGENGGIKVNEYLQTSDPNIYAVGDCAESYHYITNKSYYLPLGSTSTKMGRIAADNIAGKKVKFKGFLSTIMCKIFDYSIARTGLTLEDARQNHFKIESIIVTALDKAHYVENVRVNYFKLLVDQHSHRILGAQGFGAESIVNKIELIAFAISNHMKYEDLLQIDLGYAPFFNNPIDIIQVAGLMLEQKILGFIRLITCDELVNLTDAKLIDLSPHNEHLFDSIPGSINIPLENIRIEKIPFAEDEKIILYSKSSAGAYKAYRYLINKGFQNLYVLEGGLDFWKI